MAIKLEGGGGKALMAWPLGEELFFAASLSNMHILTSFFHSVNMGSITRFRTG